MTKRRNPPGSRPRRERRIEDDAGFRKFARDYVKNTKPLIEGSAYVITVAPSTENAARDVKLAIETGYAILLNKPLIVLVPKGVPHHAPKLLRIADHVIEADMDSEEGRERAQAELARYMKQ